MCALSHITGSLCFIWKLGVIILNCRVIARFSNFILQIIICCGGCSVHCRMQSSTSDLYSLNTNNNSNHSVIATKKDFRYYHTFTEGQNNSTPIPSTLSTENHWVILKIKVTIENNYILCMLCVYSMSETVLRALYLPCHFVFTTVL